MKYLLLLILIACGKEAKLEAPVAQATATSLEPCMALNGEYYPSNGDQYTLTLKDCKATLKHNLEDLWYKADFSTNSQTAGWISLTIRESSGDWVKNQINVDQDCAFDFFKDKIRFECQSWPLNRGPWIKK